MKSLILRKGLEQELSGDSAVANGVLAVLMREPHSCTSSSNPQLAHELGSHGGVDLIICFEFAELAELGQRQPGIAVVYATAERLAVDQVLSCLRWGVDDVWSLPMSDDAVLQHAQEVTQRVQRNVAQINHQVQEVREELERDQRAGQYIQLGMLPPNPMGIGHFRLQHRIEPSLILSGDFVDYFQITERHFACYVADVSGHGSSSAFVTVLLKNFSRRLRREYRNSMLTDPGEVLSWINTELIDQQIDKHVAMFFAIVDMQKNELRYVNAAHFPPAMIKTVDGLTHLEQKGKPLGLFPDIKYKALAVDFPQGSIVVVFTDGVLDLLSGSNLIEKEKNLSQIVASNSEMDDLWSKLDPGKLGPDDVSCLLISNGVTQW
jgi:hypothetical protein